MGTNGTRWNVVKVRAGNRRASQIRNVRVPPCFAPARSLPRVSHPSSGDRNALLRVTACISRKVCGRVWGRRGAVTRNGRQGCTSEPVALVCATARTVPPLWGCEPTHDTIGISMVCFVRLGIGARSLGPALVACTSAREARVRQGALPSCTRLTEHV